VTRALRAAFGRPYRPGDAQCDRPIAAPSAPFDGRNGSFEMPNYGAWQVSGTAFGRRPSHTHPEYQAFVNGWRGWHYVNSGANGGDAATGMLRSVPFTVQGEGISFLVGGGEDVARIGVRLVIDGHAVMQSTGHNSEGLMRVTWDVRQYAGQRAVIEIYDQSNNGWGHILVDDFRLEPVLPPGIATGAMTPAASAAIVPPPPTSATPPAAVPTRAGPIDLRARPR
jgi:hypothetical protein